MADIDYGAVFGYEGANEQEPAEPAGEETGAAQGANEQEPAEPAEVTETGDDKPAGETGEDEAGESGSGKPPQTKEENAAYAAARRKAEAERDAAIARAKAEAQQEAARQLDESIRAMGLTNPYTGTAISTKADYDVYKERFDAERKARVMKKTGMTDEEFNGFVASLPEVRQARQAQAEAERSQAEAKEAAAKVKIDEQLKEISALDPSIKELSDLTKLPEYPDFYQRVKRGMTLTEAYKLTFFEKLSAQQAAAARQAAMNASASKAHMQHTSTRGTGALTVPPEVAAQYRAFNPGITDAEISAHYNRQHRNERR